MSEPKKQQIYEASNEGSIGPNVEFYDPSQESIWTRLGVNFESFKRAPGTTG
jgi:amino acid transporter